MNRPHGRCRLFHCVSYLPLPSNTCTRWFSRSATYTQPSASQVMLCAMLNSPGSVPGPPQERSSLLEKSLSFPRFHPFELARETFREKRLGPCPLWLRV